MDLKRHHLAVLARHFPGQWEFEGKLQSTEKTLSELVNEGLLEVRTRLGSKLREFRLTENGIAARRAWRRKVTGSGSTLPFLS